MRGRICFHIPLAAALALLSPSVKAEQRTVNFYNWSNYMAPGVLEDFTRETGIKVAAVTNASGPRQRAKIAAVGATRPEALARLTRALAETDLVVAGGTSNKAFLLGLLARPEVAAADVDTDWLDRLTASGEHVPRRHAPVALVAAAVEAYEAALAVEQAQFFAGQLVFKDESMVTRWLHNHTVFELQRRLYQNGRAMLILRIQV